MENWKAIAGYEGFYEISDLGRVRGIDRLDPRGKRIKSRVLRPSINKGYPNVHLSRRGKVKTFQVHTLVLTTFIGPKPSGKECAHADGDPGNAALLNLSWKTPKENCADWLRHGTDKRGDKHPLARLSQDDVVQIKALRAAGAMYKVIGWKFSIHPIHARNIVIGKRWKHANA